MSIILASTDLIKGWLNLESKNSVMKKLLMLAACGAVGMMSGSLVQAQSDAPYTEGPVWAMTMVKTKPGMNDDYLKALAKIYKSTNDEMKKQGLIMDYKVLIGNNANAQDFDVLLMVEYKNMAAFDSLREKADPIADKILGSEEVQRQGSIKRMEIRDIMGDKLMREVTLK
jgi:hypothetical protein